MFGDAENGTRYDSISAAIACLPILGKILHQPSSLRLMLYLIVHHTTAKFHVYQVYTIKNRNPSRIQSEFSASKLSQSKNWRQTIEILSRSVKIGFCTKHQPQQIEHVYKGQKNCLPSRDRTAGLKINDCSLNSYSLALFQLS